MPKCVFYVLNELVYVDLVMGELAAGSQVTLCSSVDWPRLSAQGQPGEHKATPPARSYWWSDRCSLKYRRCILRRKRRVHTSHRLDGHTHTHTGTHPDTL